MQLAGLDEPVRRYLEHALGDGAARWRAESEEEIVATFDVPPERPEVHLRIDARGAARSVSTQRWSDLAGDGFGYVACGCEVAADRRFGDLVVPSEVTVGWWFGTPRWAPFFTASVGSLEPIG